MIGAASPVGVHTDQGKRRMNKVVDYFSLSLSVASLLDSGVPVCMMCGLRKEKRSVGSSSFLFVCVLRMVKDVGITHVV